MVDDSTHVGAGALDVVGLIVVHCFCQGNICRYVATLNVERTVDAVCCCVAWVKVVLVELKYVVMCALQLPWVLSSTFYNLGHLRPKRCRPVRDVYI